jgi:hypothetical protein
MFGGGGGGGGRLPPIPGGGGGGGGRLPKAGVEEYSFMHTSVHIVHFRLLFLLILPIPRHFSEATPVQTFYLLTIATAHP